MNAPIVIPDSDISRARLPAVYEAAKLALLECSRIDECQQWADKAEALASYARQSDDQTLRKHADRIQARAIRRCGELLRQIEPGKNRYDSRQDGTDPPNRKSAAEAAGLSERQRKTALRVANVPSSDFEAAVESDNPPTITRLAEQGCKSLVDLGSIEPKNFSAATQALRRLLDFENFAAQHDPIAIASGVKKEEIKRARASVAAIDSWLDRFIISLGD